MEVVMEKTGNTGKVVAFGHRYRDAKAAIDWLCRAFGFEKHVVFDGPDGTIAHAELTLGGGMIMLGSARDDEYGKRFKMPDELGGAETRSAYIWVPDADVAYARAVAAGARVVTELHDTHYGSRDFTVMDPEGYTWSVGTYDPWAQQG
ncbi:MAG TPA: VOC family protein [Terracidiphilus sp.]|nr:VOC family protein [Terracidiphilus sp.]